MIFHVIPKCPMRWKLSNGYHEGDFEARTLRTEHRRIRMLRFEASGAVSHRCVCEPPQQGMIYENFMKSFWMASTWKRQFGGKLWKGPQSFVLLKCMWLWALIQCLYMFVCSACVWEQTSFPAVEAPCVSGTNWTHTLLDGAADTYPVAGLPPFSEHCQAKPAPRDARLLRSDFSSCLYLVIWLQHGEVQLCRFCVCAMFYECNLDRFDVPELTSWCGLMSRFQILQSCLRQAMIIHQARCRFGSCACACGDLSWNESP